MVSLSSRTTLKPIGYIGYNTTMKKPRQDNQHTTKVTAESLRLLRLISAIKGERQYQILERLLREEYLKVSKENTP